MYQTSLNNQGHNFSSHREVLLHYYFFYSHNNPCNKLSYPYCINEDKEDCKSYCWEKFKV